MALFFDAAWYDARLSERGLTRVVLAAAAGIFRAVVDKVLIVASPAPQAPPYALRCGDRNPGGFPCHDPLRAARAARLSC